jgi:hypothetical protein
MIGFVQGGVKKDGKVFWNLVNKDNSQHTLSSPLTPTITTQSQTTVVTNGDLRVQKYIMSSSKLPRPEVLHFLMSPLAISLVLFSINTASYKTKGS